ncbi:MAG: hypothetical protein P8129_21180 [Anaerolineae bacterium]
MRLKLGNHDRDEPGQFAYRQVDVAGDDDQHHAYAEKGGDHHLPDQVRKVLGAQVGPLGHKGKEKPDSNQRQDERVRLDVAPEEIDHI